MFYIIPDCWEIHVTSKVSDCRSQDTDKLIIDDREYFGRNYGISEYVKSYNVTIEFYTNYERSDHGFALYWTCLLSDRPGISMIILNEISRNDFF